MAKDNLRLVKLYAEVGEFAGSWLTYARMEKLAHDSKDGTYDGHDTAYYKELLKEYNPTQCRGYFRSIAIEKFNS